MHREAKNPKVTLVPIASPLHDSEAVSRIEKILKARLEGLYDFSSHLVTSAAEAAEVSRRADILVLLVLTGGTEHLAMAASGGKPTVLVAHGAMNSLPAAVEAASAMRDRSWPIWIASEPEDIRSAVSSVLTGVKAYYSLRGSKLAVIGEPSPWLVYSIARTETVKAKLGISIEAVPMSELVEKFRAVEVDEVTAGGLIEGASVISVSEEEVKNAIRLYSALKSLAAEREFSAVTVRCFDLIQLADTTGCVAISLLNGEGIVAGCEADVPTALTMMLAAELSGRPAFVGNLVSASRDEVLLAHCTFPIAEADSYELTTHFESGRGVSIAASLRKGAKVTLMRFSPDLGRLRALVGVIRSGVPERRDLCRTQVRVRTENNARLLVEEPMGNHYVLAFGELAKALSAFCSLARVKLELL